MSSVLLVTLFSAACGGQAAPATGAKTTGGAAATSGAGASSGGGPLAQLYAKAKGQGPVVFMGAPPAADIRPVLDMFRKQYPGVTIRYEAKGDHPIVTTVKTQVTAGSVQFDLTGDATTFLPALVSSMMKVNWKQFGAQPDSILPQGQGLHWFDTPYAVSYNTADVKPADVPKTWNDLLKPQWANGRIALVNTPSYALSLLLSPQWGRAKALAFATKLAQQKPLIEARPILALQALVSGQAKVGLTLPFLVLKAKAQGQPVDIAPVSPQFTQHVDLFLPKGAKHVAGAELLALWLTSKPARAAFEKASYFGLAAPCDASSMARYLCSKHIQVLSLKTYKDVVQKETPFDAAFSKALGIK